MGSTDNDISAIRMPSMFLSRFPPFKADAISVKLRATVSCDK